MPETNKITIVGGGLAGLACALELNQHGIPFQLLEASDGVGGRVRTDSCDGYLLDRGFQVLLTAYPEATRILDYNKLELRNFEPGSLIQYKGKLHRFVDPLRRPKHMLSTLLSPLATLSDKLRIAKLSMAAKRWTLDQIRSRSETDTLSYLYQKNLSKKVIDHFFRPFLGGVFLESELTTSSRKFEFVFKMFAEGRAAIPNNGMGQISSQLASRLPSDSIRLNTRVRSVQRNEVQLESGETIASQAVVVACELPAVAKLLSLQTKPVCHSATCFYYGADSPPIEEPILVLNGEAEGPINNLCVPSALSPNVAPQGKSLISVSTRSSQQDVSKRIDESDVRRQLELWFGQQVQSWQFLKEYQIPCALPVQDTVDCAKQIKAQLDDLGVFACGDYLELASINGALLSGREAAKRVIGSLSKR